MEFKVKSLFASVLMVSLKRYQPKKVPCLRIFELFLG